ncbi:MAG TPA: alanine--tRNA ligase [Acidimicrobiales bacterium]|nr:alanine--tRNA ligase [Acidimicrobiales bacterium]
MTADELRRAFTEFFADRDHTRVPSAGLIPHHPTAPMFTNSGMMQFVPYFLGEEAPPFKRATTVQKCVRAGGKHNDLDAIGRSHRHVSFFEMLGNFSFGDYFKAEAIPWAWELCTEVLGLDADRLWVTVHVSDDEAEEIWRDSVGFPAARIQRLDKDNFWEMGDTGPCGPSSELFWDFGPDLGAEGGPADGGEERYVEIWNLVFPQHYRQADGSLTDLPMRGIDTGAGLERILSILQGVTSVYETDVLAGLVDRAQSVTGRQLGQDEETDVALRLLADHARTITFLVNDGVLPSNEDRGYVLRRIIRRAVRFAHLLGVQQPVTPPMIAGVVELMGDAYPEIRAGQDSITTLVEREEGRFRQTLKTGSDLLEAELAGLPAGGVLPGEVAFRLHDTYGFPLDVTREVVAERDVTVDDEGFAVAMDAQRQRAKGARKAGPADETASEAYRELLERSGPTVFTGREEPETEARVLSLLVRPASEADDAAELVEVFLDCSPFYAEAGGQVGDTGTITTATGRVEVIDTTYALPGLHRHTGHVVEGEITPDQDAVATIDDERRAAIRRNHTGTHILHWALREVLGDHVKQQGSLVSPEYLRFDFSHHEAVTDEQLAAIEDLANREVLTDESVRHYETTQDEANALGAIAFFGDKYGEVVRVLEAGRRSVELCGGTHVGALGQIGPIRITSEGSIGANQRRIFATTGTGTLEIVRDEHDRLAEASRLLGVPPEQVVDGVAKRLDEIKELRDELKSLRKQAAGAGASSLAAEAVDGVVVARVDGVSRDELKDLAVAVRDQPGVRAVVLGGAPEGGGAALVSAVTKDSGLNASELIADAARTVKGGGGKAPDLAVAGGKDPSALDLALDQVRAAAGIGG